MPDCVLLHTMMGSSVTPTAAECLNWSVTEVKSAGVPQACGLGQALLGSVERAPFPADLESPGRGNVLLTFARTTGVLNCGSRWQHLELDIRWP